MLLLSVAGTAAGSPLVNRPFAIFGSANRGGLERVFEERLARRRVAPGVAPAAALGRSTWVVDPGVAHHFDLEARGFTLVFDIAASRLRHGPLSLLDDAEIPFQRSALAGAELALPTAPDSAQDPLGGLYINPLGEIRQSPLPPGGVGESLAVR
jgi:hypothetical protein